MGWKWFKFLRAPTGSIPAASTLQQSTPIYDTTLDILQISDGVNWQKVWTTKNTVAGYNAGLDADTVSGAGITAGKKVWTTTSAAGDDGNGGHPPAPKATVSNPTITQNVQTLVYTLSGAGLYIITMSIPDASAIGNYSYHATALVKTSRDGSSRAVLIDNPAYVTITVSGSSVYCTQVSGTQPIRCTIMEVANVNG